MRLGRLTNGVSCEDLMQESFTQWLDRKGKVYVAEFRVSDVGRVADFLVVDSGRLVNIEAKCLDFQTMFDQLDDHAQYCDYCFAYIPDYAPTPVWFKERLVSKGYGLIVYNFELDCVTEVLEGHKLYNSGKKLKESVIRKVVQKWKERSK